MYERERLRNHSISSEEKTFDSVVSLKKYRETPDSIFMHKGVKNEHFNGKYG